MLQKFKQFEVSCTIESANCQERSTVAKGELNGLKPSASCL